jgi:hypothetical protein
LGALKKVPDCIPDAQYGASVRPAVRQLRVNPVVGPGGRVRIMGLCSGKSKKIGVSDRRNKQRGRENESEPGLF